MSYVCILSFLSGIRAVCDTHGSVHALCPSAGASFGRSAGDIVAAITLVSKIIRSVSSVGGAREHFQELESEFGGLLKALNEIAYFN
jgi:hypothetical protein